MSNEFVGKKVPEDQKIRKKVWLEEVPLAWSRVGVMDAV
jgi:hypothetical protein